MTSAGAKKIIVGISGASGAIYGIRLLEAMREHGLAESHLVISRSGRATIAAETEYTVRAVTELADVIYDNADMAAAISSGSFRTDGMVVAPCSMKTLSGIANSYDETLMVRAADVCLKERRTVLTLLRETPLHRGHLRVMSDAADSGVIIMPPVPAFYLKPTSVEDIVMHTVGRALDLLGLELPDATRWS